MCGSNVPVASWSKHNCNPAEVEKRKNELLDKQAAEQAKNMDKELEELMNSNKAKFIEFLAERGKV